MGQRTQLHIKKNCQFYVIHNQWGYGKYMITDVNKVLNCGLLDDKIDDKTFFNSLSKAFKLDDGYPYYSVDQGDNNNGVFLIDCDVKRYCFLLGCEDIPYMALDMPFKYIKPIDAEEYLRNFYDHWINEDNKKQSIALDQFFKENEYKLFEYYDFYAESKYLTKTFIEKSEEFAKKKNNKNAFSSTNQRGDK